MRGFRAWRGRGRRSKGKRERESKFFFFFKTLEGRKREEKDLMVRGNEAERRGEERGYISKRFFRVGDSPPLLRHSLTTHSFHILRSCKFYTEDARLRSSVYVII